MEKVKLGIIGCGQRGQQLTKLIDKISEYDIIGICDLYEDRAQLGAELCKNNTPVPFTDYKKLFDSGINTVLISTAWEYHIPIAMEAMDKGLAVAMEVGGAYDIKDCFDLVEKWEQTKVPFMFMENCCYGKDELLVTSMARSGIFGRITHCHGAYGHDLRDEVVFGKEKRHYRLNHYKTMNCDNYPTHEIGPIALLLNINRGNRMVSLTSMASCEAGITQFIETNKDKVDPDLIGQNFKQGDMVSTIIKCENGETISIRLDTSLPRHYNREFNIHGTKGLYEMGCNVVLTEENLTHAFDPVKFYKENIDNAKQYEEKYLPKIWKEITPEEIAAGHGGMDGLLYRDFAKRLINGEELPIDVYDAAVWMSITALSRKSIEEGSKPQEIPDFTKGKYKERVSIDVTVLPNE